MNELLLRRRVAKSKPYTLVDWVENTYANSYIETNVDIVNSNNYKFVGIITPIRYDREYTSFFLSNVGVDVSNKRWRFSWNNGSNRFQVLTNSSSNGARIQITENIIGVKTSFEISYRRCVLNGTTYSTTSIPRGTFLSNGKIVLAENTSNSGIMKWHELDVYLDDVLISKLRACVTKDGVYTMVDELTGYICPTEGNGLWTGGFDN